MLGQISFGFPCPIHFIPDELRLQRRKARGGMECRTFGTPLSSSFPGTGGRLMVDLTMRVRFSRN
ncbi:uncharacterized protein BDV17DRAFT_271609 [Aspergillus undulatus]|uniref:uncharacterized protein n=1 Tax=Aspergillus undulatus TaxID=1810928 RepID=UPI003CCE3D38